LTAGSQRPQQQVKNKSAIFILNDTMESDKIHIGSIIKQKIDESSFSVTEFARLVNRSRADVYDIFKRSKEMFLIRNL
jgi:hypothetical protein